MSVQEIFQKKFSKSALELFPWRVVEDQEKSFIRKLVNSNEELDILENLIETSKPRINNKNYDVYHFLLFTPFRYPPLKHGSRFANRFEPSLWYGAIHAETALREVAFYRLLFLRDTEANLKITLSLTAFSVKAKSEKAIDLTEKFFDNYRPSISSPTSYEISQPLGKKMREEGVEMFTYYSARTVTLEMNVGIFYPSVFVDGRKLRSQETWKCYADKNIVEFRHRTKTDVEKTLLCPVEEFQEKGVLAYPKEAREIFSPEASTFS